jgi:hypothetical protein
MRGFPALTIASWCFFCCLLLPLGARGAGLTAIIQPKSQTCFYEDVKEGEQGDRKVEIFVLRGGSMSVTVRVKGPYPLLSPNSLDRPRKVNRPTLNFEEDVRAKNSIAGFAERSGGDTWAKTVSYSHGGEDSHPLEAVFRRLLSPHESYHRRAAARYLVVQFRGGWNVRSVHF